MHQVAIAYAKEHLEELIERASKGEDVRIGDTGSGGVRLVPVREPDLTAPRLTDTMEPFIPLEEPRKLGQLKGKMQVPARLMEPMSDDELKDWYGDDA